MRLIAPVLALLALLLRLEPGRHRAAAPRTRGYAAAPVPEPAAPAAPRPAVTRRDVIPQYDGMLAAHSAHRGAWSIRYDPEGSPHAPYVATNRVTPSVVTAASTPDLLGDVLSAIESSPRARPYVDPQTDAEHRAAEQAALAAAAAA